ncbi:hypothetical protein [Thioalkalivibrio sp. ALJT]|uniref:hypothetical protein n=1 Tax=Thioalkalivibrio sp. ALJT TaxID=1158146 RepID=UPI0018CBE991|nr:hypothetical protein [Thioalkalivibrio sp. ALJT]
MKTTDRNATVQLDTRQLLGFRLAHANAPTSAVGAKIGDVKPEVITSAPGAKIGMGKT